MMSDDRRQTFGQGHVQRGVARRRLLLRPLAVFLRRFFIRFLARRVFFLCSVCRRRLLRSSWGIVSFYLLFI